MDVRAAARETLRIQPSRPMIPYLVLLVGLLATATSAFYLDRAARVRDHLRFDNAAIYVENSISRRIDTYTALLRASAGLFAASTKVQPEEFRRFVERLDLPNRYPGIQGIGYSVRIPSARLAAVESEMRAEAFPSFRVWPDQPRPEYHSIIYLEPLDRRNRAAIGFDMFTDPIRRDAMERAAREGTAAATGRVTLVQEIDPEKQAGFLIYVPVYAGGAPPPSEGERLGALQGFVYSPFRAGDFLRTVMAAAREPDVDLRVYDGVGIGQGSLLHDSRTGRESDAPPGRRLSATVTIEVAGRPWTLALSTRRSFHSNPETSLLMLVIGGGSLVSLMLFLATRAEVKARAAAERAANGLRRSEEALRTSEVELRRTMEAERQAHAEAAEANRAKDEFLATLSHELRTPLNAILGWSTMLKGGRLSAEQQARALDVIARNAQVQAELIEDLLDVSRIITGKLRIEMRPTLLGQAVQAALDSVRPTAEAKGVALEWRHGTDGPVLGDADRLQQVAWNLLSNAIKFTPRGGRVCASLERVGPEIELRISDTGIGVSPAFLAHMFERFTQHDSSTTREHGGMGLGLAIVRHLVEGHGGSVSAESAGEGQGATFIVRLPVRATDAGFQRAAGDRALPAVREEELAGTRALVVDDDPDSRDLLGNALTQAGARATAASSAAEALSMLDQHPFDVILADIGMPEADGYSLLRRVRSHPSARVRDLPAVAVTAYARQEDRELALDAGYQIHLAKPIEVRDLVDAVRSLVR